MSLANNEFLVSLGTVKAYDSADNFMFSAETLLDSSISVSMSNTDVVGGEGAQLLYKYMHSRRVEAKLTSATFSPDYIALNAGKTIAIGTSNSYIFDECKVLVGGVATTTLVPVGNVYVRKPDGTTVQITPTGSSVTVAGLTTETVFISYKTAIANTELITLDAKTPPNIVKLVIQTKIYSKATGAQVSTLEVVIPRFQVSGSMDIALTPESVASVPMNGMALAYSTGSCGGDNVYAEIRIIPVTASNVAVMAIAVSPSPVSVTTGNPVTLVVYGLKTLTAPFVIPNNLVTFTSTAPATATVGASTGVITKVANGSTTVTATYGGATAVVNVTAS